MESLSKLGIDGWGILVYLVNFGILWVAMAYLVFPKVIRLLDQRKAKIEDNLQTAERIQSELDETLKSAQKEKEELVTAVSKERELFKKEIAKERAELIKSADLERTQLLDEARKIIREEKKLLLSQTERDMIQLIQRVLIKILGEQVDPADVEASVKQVWHDQKEEILK